MIRGIDVTQRIEFISKEDKDEDKTVFVLKPLTASEVINISGMMTSGKAKTGDYMFELVSLSVVQIKNPDKKGEEVKDFLGTLPANILVEIADEVNKLVNISEKERKNS